jgi:hypothetical protein
MRGLVPFVLAALMLAATLPAASASETVIEDFRMQPETRWRFFTDEVMGGVSSGKVVFARDDGQPFARMTGRVSTANRGGFIQMRLDLTSAPPEGTTGVRLMVEDIFIRMCDQLKEIILYTQNLTPSHRQRARALRLADAHRQLTRIRDELAAPKVNPPS